MGRRPSVPPRETAEQIVRYLKLNGTGGDITTGGKIAAGCNLNPNTVRSWVKTLEKMDMVSRRGQRDLTWAGGDFDLDEVVSRWQVAGVVKRRAAAERASTSRARARERVDA